MSKQRDSSTRDFVKAFKGELIKNNTRGENSAFTSFNDPTYGAAFFRALLTTRNHSIINFYDLTKELGIKQNDAWLRRMVKLSVVCQNLFGLKQEELSLIKDKPYWLWLRMFEHLEVHKGGVAGWFEKRKGKSDSYRLIPTEMFLKKIGPEMMKTFISAVDIYSGQKNGESFRAVLKEKMGGEHHACFLDLCRLSRIFFLRDEDGKPRQGVENAASPMSGKWAKMLTTQSARPTKKRRMRGKAAMTTSQCYSVSGAAAAKDDECPGLGPGPVPGSGAVAGAAAAAATDTKPKSCRRLSYGNLLLYLFLPACLNYCCCCCCYCCCCCRGR